MHKSIESVPLLGGNQHVKTKQGNDGEVTTQSQESPDSYSEIQWAGMRCIRLSSIQTDGFIDGQMEISDIDTHALHIPWGITSLR